MSTQLKGDVDNDELRVKLNQKIIRAQDFRYVLCLLSLNYLFSICKHSDMAPISTKAFSVNNKSYQPAAHPIVVICLDGSADEYLDATLLHDRMPHLKKMVLNGYRGMVRGALPSFTNVNNSSIVTGVSPAVHGISGNFFYDAAKDKEVMMNYLLRHLMPAENWAL
jgi:predicted AlkP superfamily pyrophosphatase or phosphodiesterase